MSTRITPDCRLTISISIFAHRPDPNTCRLKITVARYERSNLSRQSAFIGAHQNGADERLLRHIESRANFDLFRHDGAAAVTTCFIVIESRRSSRPYETGWTRPNYLVAFGIRITHREVQITVTRVGRGTSLKDYEWLREQFETADARIVWLR
jgi:hypothetical protein